MKKGLAIVIAGVIIVATAAGAYVIGTKGDKPNAPTETSSLTQASETTAPAETETETTTETTTESTTETTEAATVKEPAFIKNGYFYLFDDKNTTCTVFKFGKNGKVDIAYFDKTNLVDEDPEYFKGYAEYTFDGETLTVKKLPKAVKKSSISLTVKGSKLYCDGEKLDQNSKLSLIYAGEHFA